MARESKEDMGMKRIMRNGLPNREYHMGVFNDTSNNYRFINITKRVGAEVYISVKLKYVPVPRTLEVTINNNSVTYHTKGKTCWIDVPVKYGYTWHVAYERESWEARARRTWT